MDKGKVQSFFINSKELNEQIEILVYLPSQFTPLYKYPYCIAQDGKDYFQLGRISRTLDELIHNGEIEPIIFFGIPYSTVEDRRNKYHPKGEMHNAYVRFLINEVVPYIEFNFPVLHMGASRALLGDSLAATISLLTSLQYPHTFGKLLLHSPYVDDSVINKVESFQDGSLLTIYHTVGTQEYEVKMTDGNVSDFLTPNRRLSEIIQQNQADYFYDEFNGNHTWKYWQEDLKRGLRYLFSN